MKKTLLGLILLASCPRVEAQIDPLYAQYLTNPLAINPAYTGLNNNLNLAASFRKQWAGFEGSPTTMNITAHTSLLDDRMAIGAILLSDKVGANKNTEAHVTYAYKIVMGKNTLAFGLQAGFVNFRSNNSELNPFDPTDPAFSNDVNLTRPSFGAGVILKSERYFIGLSAPRMLSNSVSLNGITVDLYEQHFYGMAAYVINVSDRLLLKPSLLVRGVKAAPLSLDYNIAFTLDQKYTMGLFARNLNTCGLLAQIRFAEVYRLAYTFEAPLNNAVETRFNTHELSFGVNLSALRFQTSTLSNF